MQTKKLIPAPLLVIIDILLTGIALCVFAYFHHVRPSSMSERVDVTQIEQQAGTNTGSTTTNNSDNSSNTDNQKTDNSNNNDNSSNTSSSGFTDFSGKFADKFSDKATYTDKTYSGPNSAVTVTTVSENNLTYHIEDIYVKTVESLKTGFAEDAYGKSITDWPQNIAANKNAVAAVNGDYYGIHNTGLVIRNGYAYRTSLDGSSDICVIFKNGEMKTYANDSINVDEVIAAGAYQAWSFGPVLVADNKALTNFGRNRIANSNPRTGIGYYEPGHYCFVSVDGRNANGSDGLSLSDFASLFASMGCNRAYNLDGGKSSVMVFNDNLVNSPSDGGRKSSDIVYVAE